MSEDSKISEVSQEPPESTVEAGEPKQARPQALSGLSRRLTDKDLKDPAVGRLLLQKIDEQETTIRELSEFREKFHDANTRAEVLNERLKSLKESLNTRTAFNIFGGIIAGFLPSLWGYPALFFPAGIVAMILLGIGVFKK
jgi:hypothetical protein